MEQIPFDEIIKVITWIGGVVISIWVIRLLREINSKQKEYISIIEKTYQEREKTRDQKIELLDTTHKKEIELIEREKSIFYKTLENEKKNMELSNNSSVDNSLTDKLIAEIKEELSLVVTKVSSLNVMENDLSQMKEIVGLATNMNRKVNFISNEENHMISNKENVSSSFEEINLYKFTFEIYKNIFSNNSFEILFNQSFINLNSILFNKKVLYSILMEILSNVEHHSISKKLIISGIENNQNTKIIFENSTDLKGLNINDDNYWNDNRPSGLNIVKDVMKRYKNEVLIATKDDKFKVELNFKRNNVA